MKKVKKLTIILAIILVCMISFGGIYIEKNGIVKNIIKDYNLGMGLGEYREARMNVAKGEEVTAEKVEQTKQLLQKRLEKFGVKDYLIKANYTTGEIVLEIEETNKTDQILSDIYNTGTLKMADSEDNTKVFLTNDDIKEISAVVATSEEGANIYLNLEFTEEASKTIEELSKNEYKTIEKEKKEESTENDQTGEKTTETEVKQPKLALLIGDSKLGESSFDFPITTGSLQFSLGTVTTQERIQDLFNNAETIVKIVNNGPLPIKYELNGNTYIQSEITEQMKNIVIIALVAIIVIAFVVLVIKYKMSAILGLISYIGFIAIYLLILNYTNVIITFEGIAGIVFILIVNYWVMNKILTKITIIETLKEIGIKLVPVVIPALIFTFMSWTNLASFGMTIFWGILVTAGYHFVITKGLIEK